MISVSFHSQKIKKVLLVYPGKNASVGVSELYNIVKLNPDRIHYFELYGPLRT